MNTRLPLRTMLRKDWIAEIRAGATLLYDSDPDAEEAETRLKAAALVAAIRGTSRPAASTGLAFSRIGSGRKILLIDHEDSFVHTLAGYIRTTGAEVTTLRHDFAREQLRKGLRPDLVVLSPGPGRPEDFAIADTLDLLNEKQEPGLGVCLGLQRTPEYLRASLAVR